MKKCINCKHLYGDNLGYYCSINCQYISHPLFMGGKKCPCYKKFKLEKTKFEYPQKENKQ